MTSSTSAPAKPAEIDPARCGQWAADNRELCLEQAKLLGDTFPGVGPEKKMELISYMADMAVAIKRSDLTEIDEIKARIQTMCNGLNHGNVRSIGKSLDELEQKIKATLPVPVPAKIDWDDFGEWAKNHKTFCKDQLRLLKLDFGEDIDIKHQKAFIYAMSGLATALQYSAKKFAELGASDGQEVHNAMSDMKDAYRNLGASGQLLIDSTDRLRENIEQEISNHPVASRSGRTR